MSRRGDNIRKRKDGRWEARYARREEDGSVTKYSSVYGKTYQEVKAKREVCIKQGAAKNAGNVCTFKALLEVWQESNRIRLKDASVSRYQNLIDAHILPMLGDKKITQLNAPLINRFLHHKLSQGRLDGKGGLSAAYVRSIALIITSALKYGASQELCSPLRSAVAKPNVTKKEPSVLSTAQQTVLEQELLTATTPEKLLIYLTLYTGLRIGEACALRWEDIDPEAKLIYVRQTVSRVWYRENGKKYSKLTAGLPKTAASQRSIPLCSKLQEVLRQFHHKEQNGYVLPGIGDGFISPRTFEYRYKKILRQCGLDPINYHALRHTFATRCIERGVDIKSLSEILGHADAAITLNTYVHVSLELKRQQLEKLSA